MLQIGSEFLTRTGGTLPSPPHWDQEILAPDPPAGPEPEQDPRTRAELFRSSFEASASAVETWGVYEVNESIKERK